MPVFHTVLYRWVFIRGLMKGSGVVSGHRCYRLGGQGCLYSPVRGFVGLGLGFKEILHLVFDVWLVALLRAFAHLDSAPSLTSRRVSQSACAVLSNRSV